MDPNATVTITGQHIGERTDEAVQHVEIVNSNLSHVPLEIFEKFPSLKSLDIRNGSLETFNQLRNCDDLSVLSIITANLEVFPANVLSECQKFSRLSLTANPLVEFEADGLESMEYLSIFEGKLTKFPNISNLVNLKTITLEGNSFTELTGDEFVGLAELSDISLPNNRIQRIHPSTFQEVPQLSSLNLERNLISNISNEAFSWLRFLTFLSLRGNIIRRIDRDSFVYSNEIVFLYLSDNQIEVIEDGVFRNFQNLRYLLIARNVCIDQDFSLAMPGDWERIFLELKSCLPSHL